MTIRPTITSIAAAAKVSHSTVSLVLNGRGEELGIKAQTQKRVLEIAKQVNYVPNTLARNLRDNKTKTIGVLWSLGRPGAEGMLDGISNRIRIKGFSTQLVPSSSDPNIISDALTDMIERRVEGVVIQASRELLNNSAIAGKLENFNAVVAITYEPVETKHNLIARDTPSIIKNVVDYFIATGRKHPCFLTFGEQSSYYKYKPFLERLKYHGICADNAIIEAGKPEGVHTPSNHLDYFRAVLANKFPKKFQYDALFGATDDAAAAALMHLKTLGLCIPEDVALVGFNNSDLTKVTDPPLASISWDGQAAADTIERYLFQQLDEPRRPPQQITLPMQFIWRKSAGPKPDNYNNT